MVANRQYANKKMSIDPCVPLLNKINANSEPWSYVKGPLDCQNDNNFKNLLSYDVNQIVHYKFLREFN